VSDDDAEIGTIPGVLVDEQPNDMSLREFVGCAIRSPSFRTRRQGVLIAPELKPEDLFPMVDPNEFPELDDETMRRVVDRARQIIDEYFRNAEQMTQRCFIEPSNVFDLARRDAERELFASVAPEDPKLDGYRW
jgi:hypothetical protein